MKKLATLVMAGAMMASLMSVASAERLSIPVRCDSTTNYTNNSETALKESGSAAIYVYHHDNVDTDEYTNHFRGIEVKTNITRGSKWCTQGLSVPIQNNNIKSGTFYTVSARGNTNYYNNDGISRITLNGHYDVNK